MVYTNKDRVEVIIATSVYRIEGEMYVLAGSRLTDALNSKAKDFFAITDARVFDVNSGKLLYEPEYIAVSRASIVAIFPGNHGTDLDSHQGLVALFDIDNGVPIAIMDASEITAIRTAATSGVATRLLARGDAGDLAILGSGVQARTHLEAMALPLFVDGTGRYVGVQGHGCLASC